MGEANVLTLEQRVTALETKLQEEVDRLYNVEFPAIDEQINRAISNSYEVGDKANARVQAGVDEARATTNELQRFVNDQLALTVRKLIAQSSSEVVAEALAAALKSAVLVTRPATRHDDPSNVLVVRPAPAPSRS